MQYSVLADLHLFDPNFSSSSDNLTHVGETLVTKQTAWALSHFYVEFPHALSLPIPLPSHSNASLPSPSSSTNRDLLQSYLHYLMILHQKQYDTAQRCRKSDSIRGRKIISDYDEVHPSVESDEVLSSLRGEVEMLRTELTSLLNDLLD